MLTKSFDYRLQFAHTEHHSDAFRANIISGIFVSPNEALSCSEFRFEDTERIDRYTSHSTFLQEQLTEQLTFQFHS